MKIKAVIFDWAGTVVDFGCFAPVDAFVQAFAAKKIKITIEEVRKPMGMLKRDHIKAILDMPRVNKLWQDTYGKPYTDKDIDEMHDNFEGHLMAALLEHNTVIDGVLDTVAALRERGLKIGSTTGYTQKMMAVVAKDAKQRGYAPDSIITPDEVGHGRPYPYMIYQNMKNLRVFPPSAIVKVGDTVSDIEEGINSGTISVGVVVGSSMLGLSKKEFDKLSKDQKKHAIEKARKKFYRAGAHYVIKDITQLPKLIDKINKDAMNTKHIPENPYLLLTPGPLSTSKSVKATMLQDWCTWDTDYNSLVQEIRRVLVSLATTDVKVYSSVLMQGSGTFCVESVIGSAIPKAGKLLVLANGAYGKRIGEIAGTLGIKYSVQDSGETSPIDIEFLKTTLEEDPKITHVAVVHCETTTGMLNDIQKIGDVVKLAGKVYIVDAMSSFGGIPIDIAQIGADFMISSSNKCIQGVPGFGFVIAKTEELAKCRGNARSLSLDLFAQWDTMEKGEGKWRYTSPTHVVRAFYEALQELEQEGGVINRHARYSENQHVLVDGMERLGFKALLPKAHQSPIITSFCYPDDSFSFQKLYYALKNKGFIIYPGKISETNTFRIGNIGEVYKEDIEKLLTAIGSASL